MENNRGDIPITLLVILTIAVCGIALFSFYSSTSIHMRTYFIGVGLMEQINSQIENKTFFGEDPAGLYFEKNTTSGFFGLGKQETLFSAQYKFKP